MKNNHTPTKTRVLISSPPEPEKAERVLKSLGIWDVINPSDRIAFVERGEILATKDGYKLYEIYMAGKEMRAEKTPSNA